MTQILVWEGLSPLLIPWLVPSYVKRGLLDPLATHMSQIGDKNATHIWRGGFMSSGPNARPQMSSSKVIVIGHSMGGASAIAWCETWRRHLEVDLLLTLDPRPLHRPYIKPPNVKRAVNLYQKSFWMPGYEVEGAENILLTDGTSHTGVPWHPKARDVLIGAV